MKLSSALSATAALLATTGGVSLYAGTISFFVNTNSQAVALSTAGVAGDNSASATYNTNTGATSSTSLGVPPGTATATGSPNTLGLSSSFDQTSATTPLPGVGTTTATSFAAANLATGAVRAQSSGSSLVPGFIGQGMSTTTAELFDTLTFIVAGATPSTLTNIGINVNLDGSVTSDGEPGIGNSQVDSALVFQIGNQPSADAEFDFMSLSSPQIAVVQQGWASENVSSATLSNFAFQGVMAGQGATFTADLDLKLTVICTGAACDYSNTDLVSLSLPSNVTYTSSSGVFLTQSATPEPASWAMMLGGLILVAGEAAKRRYRSRP